jgi:hypothetical protein
MEEKCNVGDSYLASAHLGMADVLRAGLTITSNNPSGTLDLVISPDGASLEGVVIKAEKPVSGATVHIELADAQEGRHSQRPMPKATSTVNLLFMDCLPDGMSSLPRRMSSLKACIP